MHNAPETFIVFQVSSAFSEDAFTFHQSAGDEHIWPRTQEEILQFCERGELFAIRRASSGEYVGLCYVYFDEEKNQWELGGLVVSHKVRGLHLGSVLARFAVAHTIANQRPWTYGEEIIAHVLEANNTPRNVLPRTGFEHVGKTDPVPSAPASMKRNAEGQVIGDIFQFPRRAILDLAKWFSEFDAVLADGRSRILFEIRPGGIDSLREALNQASEEFGS